MYEERRNCDIGKYLLFLYIKAKKQVASLLIFLLVKCYHKEAKAHCSTLFGFE